MKHHKDFYLGVKDFKLYYQAWIPEENPKAVIQLIHGIAEHSGRYSHLVNALVSNGFVVYGSDLRGHGKSDGIRGHVEKFEFIIEDQKKFQELIKSEQPGLPLFMLGYSFGSTISVIYQDKHANGIKGLILASAGVDAGQSTSPFLKAIASFLALIIPKSMIDPKLVPEYLSRDPEVVKEYKKDPLVAKKISIRFGSEFVKSLKEAIQLAPRIKLPTLVQCGSGDKIASGVDKIDKLMQMPDKTLKIYPGLYHDIFNELEEDRNKVIKDTIDWLNNHI